MESDSQDIHTSIMREYLIDGMIDLSHVSPIKIATALRLAVTKNDTTFALSIIDQAPEILQYDNGGGRMLWEALENGNEMLARKLVFAGADVNYRSRNGCNVLHSFMSRYESLATFMIEHGADINVSDSSGNTVLFVAVREGLESIVDAIARMDLIYIDEARILKEAAANDYTAYLLAPLVKSSDLVTRKRRAKLALPMYLEMRSPDEVDMVLVMHLIDVAMTSDYTSPEVIEILQTVVVLKNHTNTVNLLLGYVQVLNGESEDVASLLCSASRHAESTMSILLMKNGANFKHHNKDQEYPLHYACYYKSLQNIHLLLSLEADLTVVDKRGRTPFAYMSSEPFGEQHKLVLRHFAIMSAKNIKFNEKDLERIHLHQRMRVYYEECLNELEKMKSAQLYEDETFFCFFNSNIEKLSTLLPQVNCLQMYYGHQMEGNVSFPRYSMHIHHIFRMAIDRKNFVIGKAKAIEDATKVHPPPYFSLGNIRYNMACLIDFERKYYFRLHEKINDENEPAYGLNMLY